MYIIIIKNLLLTKHVAGKSAHFIFQEMEWTLVFNTQSMIIFQEAYLTLTKLTKLTD